MDEPNAMPSAGARAAARPQPLTQAEIAQALDALPGWTVAAPAPDGPPARRELRRSYRFGSFADAVAFMAAAVPLIEALDHHPRWENVFRTVAVRLSTWDRGHVVTRLDVELATGLEALHDGLKRNAGQAEA